jgi:hypothetical protein
MKNKPKLFTILSLIMLILISCSLPEVLSPAPAKAAIPTFLPTLQLSPTQPPVQQATKIPPRPRVAKTPATNIHISTPITLSTPITVSTPLPCNKARLLPSGTTVPDGTVFHPGDPVVKTWQVMNVGSCTWTKDYKLIFDRGYNFLGIKSINLAQAVAPGQMANITVNFTAPTTPLGNYESYWNLQGPAGFIFGVGPTGDVPLDIRISIQPKPVKK